MESWNWGAMNKSHGFTLLETLVALSLLMVVVVPLLGYLAGISRITRARDMVTAICILEQEQLQAQHFPDDMRFKKRKNIANDRWQIEMKSTGDHLKKISMSVEKNNSFVSQVVFYVYHP